MIYEPEYIKILRKSQFCGKDNKLVKLNKNENFSDQGITRIAFEKIDKAFTLVNGFIDKMCNKLEIVINNNKVTKNYQNSDGIHTFQIYQNEQIKDNSTTKKETSSNTSQINFQDLSLLNDKLASLLFNKVSSSNNDCQQSFEKNNYGLTQSETIQFKRSIINLVNQMNKDFSL
ncbi:hypothetical protein ChUKH1_09265 [Cryptosporidium hominis]|uniref:Uncharacterized protein n=2 Tax=Cryptosporidium hominis TaxID=237895 RepID=A0ABX5BA01_CRYHO|nr:hypothetical protein ChTU502y2012_389g0120 [Cryptosporidium hominis]PPA63723.1 hypothetical protein ChUKH1_09265 [Cryptosporidium hominis]PPS92767.1 Uncharacterized protein GY17_00002628 [Cryptosporidium hominis]|eukprot:PPS92767.1 Uncharacterized protein GY17_00002628 [Cryptosporidium hominis]